MIKQTIITLSVLASAALFILPVNADAKYYYQPGLGLNLDDVNSSDNSSATNGNDEDNQSISSSDNGNDDSSSDDADKGDSSSNSDDGSD